LWTNLEVIQKNPMSELMSNRKSFTSTQQIFLVPIDVTLTLHLAKSMQDDSCWMGPELDLRSIGRANALQSKRDGRAESGGDFQVKRRWSSASVSPARELVRSTR
jgi:hypothetical protein